MRLIRRLRAIAPVAFHADVEQYSVFQGPAWVDEAVLPKMSRRHEIKRVRMLRNSFCKLLRPAFILICLAPLIACASDPPPDAVAPPVSSLPTAPGRAAFYVKIGKGQTLDQLARQYGVSKRKIIAANQLTAPYNLKPGSQIEIPLDGRKRKNSSWASTTKSTKTAAADRKKTATAPRHVKSVAKSKPQGPAIIPLDDPA